MSWDWYHGGVPGLQVGDLILPPDKTGTEHRLSMYAPALAPHGTRTDVVYLAKFVHHARVFAAMYPDGALYAVEAIGPVETDPDAPEHSLMAAEARITDVVRPRIYFAHRRPESWFRMLDDWGHDGS